MTGIEILEWAVRKCTEENVPPTDNAIVRMIRFHLIDVDDARKRQKEPFGPAWVRAKVEENQRGFGRKS